ncbi:unnamed protein product [Schistosoma intercalatum]|nr:unnamed protein product [Schistosoma intercalatum]CAH8589105.1 unnamed protein product [Schistosoma intercalatum]
MVNACGYGWGFGQNATTTSLWEQPQIGFCFDSPNPQIPEACPPPIQNPGVIGFAYDQAVANPPLVSPVSSQSNSSTDRTFNVTSQRLNVPPSIEAMRPKSYINYSDESFAPSAPPESISPHSESVKFITITRKDSKKSDTSKTITNTNDQHNQRRDSYQDSLKDMAALMTDVELTDDMINGMRKRFDLHN